MPAADVAAGDARFQQPSLMTGQKRDASGKVARDAQGLRGRGAAEPKALMRRS